MKNIILIVIAGISLVGCTTTSKVFVKNEKFELLKTEPQKDLPSESTYVIEVVSKPSVDDETLTARVSEIRKSKQEMLNTYSLKEVHDVTTECPGVWWNNKCEFSHAAFWGSHLLLLGFLADLAVPFTEHEYRRPEYIPTKKTLTELEVKSDEFGKRILANGEAEFRYGDEYKSVIRAKVEDGIVKFPMQKYITYAREVSDDSGKIVFNSESEKVAEIVSNDLINKHDTEDSSRRDKYQASSEYAFKMACDAYKELNETIASSQTMKRNMASQGLDPKMGQSGIANLASIHSGQFKHWQSEYKTRSGKEMTEKDCGK
ncbi:MAG: hypothetical protein A4S09_14125 [Proteobacteria bacterium SG_bin7]|nr:MAG: hypothetical protein A4S09_14125 [Proteobacteria bacterium SG_bin7]